MDDRDAKQRMFHNVSTVEARNNFNFQNPPAILVKERDRHHVAALFLVVAKLSVKPW